MTKAGGLGTLAFITSFRFACMIILMPISGALIERCNKIKVMIWADVLRFAMMLALIVTEALSPGNLVALAGLASATAFFGVFFAPARRAVLPKVVEEQHRTTLNALDGIIGTATLAIAPAIGGFLLSYLDDGAIFAINSAGFLISAFLIVLMKSPAIPSNTTQHSSDNVPKHPTHWLHDCLFGVKELMQNKETRYITLLACSSHLIVGSTWIFVAAIAFSLGRDGPGIGYLSSAIGLGSVLGLFIGGGTRGSAQKRQTAMAILLLSLTVLGWTFLQSSFIGTAIICFFLGVFANIFEAPCWTILQKETDESAYARVFSAFDALTLAAMLVGTYLSALLIETFDIAHSIVALGALSLAIFITTMAIERNRDLSPCKYPNH